MRKRFIIAGMIAISAYLSFIFIYLRSDESSPQRQTAITGEQREDSPDTSTQEGNSSPTSQPIAEDPRLDRLADGSVRYLPAIETSEKLSAVIDPADALTLIDDLLAHYRYAYKENPVGVENFEFTEQLMGKNPMRIVFIDTTNKALIDNQLVDSWSTPYFFHPISSDQIEIRSAGPDKQLWTDDDLSTANPN
ncbi:MAG: hypothetical protein ACON4O_04885 [Lentimonas sp.]